MGVGAVPAGSVWRGSGTMQINRRALLAAGVAGTTAMAA